MKEYWPRGGDLVALSILLVALVWLVDRNDLWPGFRMGCVVGGLLIAVVERVASHLENYFKSRRGTSVPL